MAVRRNKPIWLIIAVTKIDLYPDDVDEVVRYYSPGSGSPFAERVDALRALAGGAKLSVDVLPVSSQGGDRKSALPEKRASALVDALADRLGQRAATPEPAAPRPYAVRRVSGSARPPLPTAPASSGSASHRRG